MTRWLAGEFHPHTPADSHRLAAALAPEEAVVVQAGPLSLAYTGPRNDERSPLCLVDGFLDNIEDLADELACDRAASPEEILGVGWRRWGLDLLGRLRGDFALVIWDEQRDEGLIARDQLGVRSMFLHDAHGPLRFASEIRPLLALLPSRPAPDAVSVAHWITMSSRPGSATLYTGVRRLNPGSALLLDRSGAREVSYWAPRFSEPLDEREPELAERVRESLQAAVTRRISPTGLTGVLMSGGLDSASVAALAATGAPDVTLAYSGVFPDHPDVDESALIDELRGTLKLSGISAHVQPGGLVASALESVRDWELPLLGWGDFWTLPLLRAAAAAGVQITLGGDGGDEVFGARSYLLADRLRAGHPLQALALARELPGAGDRPPRREVARIARELAITGALPYRLHDIVGRLLERRSAPPWMSPTLARELLDSDDPWAWKRLDGPRWWAHIAHGLTRGIEETGVFEHQRRLAASAGLQARHPLLDFDLLELSLRLPPLSSFDRYRSRPVLRAAMQGLLPDSVRLRPQKAYFDSLLIDCLTGPDAAAARVLLTDPSAELRAFVDLKALQKELFETTPQDRVASFRWMWQMWRLLTAEVWLRAQAQDPALEFPVSDTQIELQTISHPAPQGA